MNATCHVLSVGCALLLTFASPAADDERPVKLSADEKALVDLANQERKKEKLPALTVNPVLCQVARRHTENMARQERLSHQLDGKSVGGRVDEAGYDYRVVRENLARADGEPDDPPPTPAELHARWMESAGHRGNILHPRVSEIGLSILRSKKGVYFVTQVFALPRSR
ncbi:MAG: CAP domain-containing protein [Gemmataceae bacterium]